MHATLVVFASASPTRKGVDNLDRFAVLFDQMADVDNAVVAGVGALVVVVVILILSGWVRGLRCRLTLAAHGVTPPE
jgi:hypothetical protein